MIHIYQLPIKPINNYSHMNMYFLHRFFCNFKTRTLKTKTEICIHVAYFTLGSLFNQNLRVGSTHALVCVKSQFLLFSFTSDETSGIIFCWKDTFKKLIEMYYC